MRLCLGWTRVEEIFCHLKINTSHPSFKAGSTLPKSVKEEEGRNPHDTMLPEVGAPVFSATFMKKNCISCQLRVSPFESPRGESDWLLFSDKMRIRRVQKLFTGDTV